GKDGQRRYLQSTRRYPTNHAAHRARGRQSLRARSFPRRRTSRSCTRRRILFRLCADAGREKKHFGSWEDHLERHRSLRPTSQQSLRVNRTRVCGDEHRQPLFLICATASVSNSVIRVRICCSVMPLVCKSLISLCKTSLSPAFSKSAMTMSLA